MRAVRGILVCGILAGATPTSVIAAQPSIDILLARIDALQRRVDQLEGRVKKVVKTTKANKPAAAAPDSETPYDAAQAPLPPFLTKVRGLAPPEPMGEPFEDALRSDLPGMALRIPGTQSEVRVYGFAKLTGYRDFNSRNQNDTVSPQAIPLVGSPAWRQGGDLGMSARFSRIGVDTRTLTGLGTLETRIEGDFGGGGFTSNNHTFRLRQAWAELGTSQFRVLFGQANSLWNEGLFETLNDSTNLNQSFVRQAQLRVIGTIAPGLTGQVSLEAPETQYTSVLGVFTPATAFGGGLSPAFNSLPDLLGRLAYRNNGLEIDMRGVVRQLSLRTAGTAAVLPTVTQNAVGWGTAGHVRFPMQWLADAFGPDQLIAMGYYGKGIGRYFGGNTFGQDALSNMGLPWAIAGYGLDPVTSYGATVAYRRFWTDTLRSNLAYSYARQAYPTYAFNFLPGTVSSLSLNRNIQQVIGNLIWSPFAEVRDGVVNTGWLDVGVEYIRTWRGLYGGPQAAFGVATDGYGVANRVMGGAVGRF